MKSLLEIRELLKHAEYSELVMMGKDGYYQVYETKQIINDLLTQLEAQNAELKRRNDRIELADTTYRLVKESFNITVEQLEAKLKIAREALELDKQIISLLKKLIPICLDGRILVEDVLAVSTEVNRLEALKEIL